MRMSQEKTFYTAAAFFALQLFGWFAWLNIFNIEAMVKHGEVQYAEVANYAMKINAEVATISMILSISLLAGIAVQTFIVPWIKGKMIVIEDTDGSTDDAARETATQP